ncbi:MAG: UDP-3-O-(3-hydroxymyristoyl)glucosamine N-acyltransferase [Pseudomonadota bacterium]
MADPAFFKNHGPFTIGKLARHVGGRLVGDDHLAIHDLAPLDHAGQHELSWLTNMRYHEQFEATAAGAILVPEERAETLNAPSSGAVLVFCDRPYHALALISQLFYPPSRPPAGLHPTAVIDPGAEVGAGVSIAAHAVIADGVVLGEEAVIGSGAVIDQGVQIGARTVVGPLCYLGFCLIGSDCQIHSGARIGTRGFGFDADSEGMVEIAQTGRVVIGSHVEIGANTTIDRGMSQDTEIGDHVRIDNLVHLAHNVQIGAHTILAGQVGMAGSAVIGKGVLVGGQAGIAGHLTVGDGAMIAAQSGVVHSLPAGRQVWFGTPVQKVKVAYRAHRWLMKQSAQRKPDKTKKTI